MRRRPSQVRLNQHRESFFSDSESMSQTQLSQRQISELLDRAKLCVPKISVGSPETQAVYNKASDLLRNAVDLLEKASEAVAVFHPEIQEEDGAENGISHFQGKQVSVHHGPGDDDGDHDEAATLFAGIDPKRASLNLSEISSQELAEMRQRQKKESQDYTKSPFIRKLRTVRTADVTHDYSSPKIGSRRLLARKLPSSRSRESMAATDPLRSRAMELKAEQDRPSKRRSAETPKRTRSSSNTSATQSMLRKAGQLMSAATEAIDPFVADTDERTNSFVKPLPERAAARSRVTVDYDSPGYKNRHLSAKNHGKSSRAAAAANLQQMAAEDMEDDDHAEHPDVANLRNAAIEASPPISPQLIKGAKRLADITLGDMQASDKKVADDIGTIESTPKPHFLRALKLPDGQKGSTAYQKALEELISRASSKLSHVPYMELHVVERVTMLLQIAVDELEKLSEMHT
jgi:hypothetical protein